MSLRVAGHRLHELQGKQNYHMTQKTHLDINLEKNL